MQDWIEKVAHVAVDGLAGPPDVCVIELGGTVGDIESMPFIEVSIPASGCPSHAGLKVPASGYEFRAAQLGLEVAGAAGGRAAEWVAAVPGRRSQNGGP